MVNIFIFSRANEQSVTNKQSIYVIDRIDFVLLLLVKTKHIDIFSCDYDVKFTTFYKRETLSSRF